MQPIAKPLALVQPLAKPDPWRPGAPEDPATSVLREKNVTIVGDADLVEARRAMRELAAEVGFADSGCVLLTLVASELARNFVQCSRHGELLLRAIASPRGEGIEVLAVEHPADGITAGGPSGPPLGISLSGVDRLMDEFEAAFPEGGGRMIRARKWLPSVVGRAAQRSEEARERAASRREGPLRGPRLESEYSAALHQFMEAPSERALARVYALARGAMGQGLGLLDLAALHRQALDAAPRRPGPGGDESIAALHLAHDLFAEALAPFELAAQGAPADGDDARRSPRATSSAQASERLENELQRVAHSLHDEVQQQLVLVSLSLDDLRRSAPSTLAPRIEHTLRQIDEVSDRVRTLSHELRPRVLDDLGLVPALELLAQGMARRHHVRIDIHGSAGGRLPPAVETALYRVAQEGLQNAARHAGAGHIEIRLERLRDRLRFMLHDDGRGFDTIDVARRASGSLGLIGMRERVQGVGGALHIESSPGQGTRITALVPTGDADVAAQHSN